jgi:ferredoxin-type protein NapH
MSATTAARSRHKKRATTIGGWPRIRFAATIVFLLLVVLSTRFENVTISTSYIGIGEWGIACPLGVAQVLAATGRPAPALAVAGLAGILLIVLWGRAFCSWICPGRWIFNRGPAQAGQPWKHRAWVQRIIVGGVVGAAYACHNPLFCTICPAGVICRGAIAAGTGGSLLPAVGWLSALVGMEWATGRSWCRDMCPLGAAISQLSRLNPFLKPKRNLARCVPCAACQRACLEGLNLAHCTDISTCTKCLACLSACPRDAVEVKLW